MPEVITTRTYCWDTQGRHHDLNLVWVPGTDSGTYLFGREPMRKAIPTGSRLSRDSVIVSVPGVVPYRTAPVRGPLLA